jgi:preprotein translocase subunit SecY
LTWQLKDTSTVRSSSSPGDFEQDMMGGNRQWIPLKLNASGVMPIIFAQAIMFIPAAVLVYLSQMHRSPLLALLVICSVLV